MQPRLKIASPLSLHDELGRVGRLDCVLRGTRPRGGLLITHFYGLEVKAMANELSGRKVAVLATDGVEQVELTEPVKALKQASAEVHVVAPKEGEIQGFNHHERGDRIPVDVPLQQADPNTYDALVLPGFE